MAHIPETLRNCRNIPGGYPTGSDDSPCVIICRLTATKPFRNNQETNTPPRKCQVLHIGCICVLPEAPSEQPEHRVLRSNNLTLIVTTQGLQNARPNNQISEIYTSKASSPHLKADKNTPEHSYWSTDCQRIFLRHAVMRVLENL